MSGSLLRVDPETGQLRARRYRLRVLSGPEAGQQLELTGRHVLGSLPGSSLTLSDPTVSRHHLELEARSDGVRAKDLSSTNGTFLAGARIESLLIENDLTLTVGKTQVRIEVQEDRVEATDQSTSFGQAVGASPAMRRLFGLLERVASSDSTVLLLGETGTGKEVLARAVHDASPRAHRPFVIVDCGAAAPSLIESELFGHARGAFTGAVSARTGAFLEADGGTLFLDEIGELPLELQPKLLRVLEAGTVKRLGEDRVRQVNVRIVAATHRDLRASVEKGSFRRDLYFRLAVVPAVVPPLRERTEDLPLLVDAILRRMGREDFHVSEALLGRLAGYEWPGNVRELRNVIERALSGADLDEETPTPGAPPPAPSALSPTPELAALPFKEAKEKLVDAFTREYLRSLLERCEGNISRAAREAGLARNHIYNLVSRYGLKTDGQA